MNLLQTHHESIVCIIGILSMIQDIRATVQNPSDRTTITLIYAADNVNQVDILLKDDLEELMDIPGHEQRFKVFYVLNDLNSSLLVGCIRKT